MDAYSEFRIIHSVASTAQRHGGPSRSVPALCDALGDQGYDVHLITGIPVDGRASCILPTKGATTHAVGESNLFRQFGMSGGFRDHLRRLSTSSVGQCIVHDHGLWLQTNHAIASEARRLGVKRVVAPRGMLSEWSLNRRCALKQVMWKLYQQRDLVSATAFQATSQAEARDIRQLGFRQPIAVIPNGVDFPKTIPGRIPTSSRTLLCLSRIHPVKGLANLLHAFHQSDLPDCWQLTLVGPDEGGHRAELEALTNRLELSDRVTFQGLVNDAEKWRLYADSDLFVLPSFTENFGISIAEAMAAQLPVITTTGTPWQVLREKRMGWWVEPSISSLQAALREATALSECSRQEMGVRASKYARNCFSWNHVGSKMIEFYRWLTQHDLQKPEFLAT